MPVKFPRGGIDGLMIASQAYKLSKNDRINEGEADIYGGQHQHENDQPFIRLQVMEQYFHKTIRLVNAKRDNSQIAYKFVKK